jgi:hypothetical protein
MPSSVRVVYGALIQLELETQYPLIVVVNQRKVFK